MFSDVMEGHSSHILTETDQAVEGTKRSHRVTIYETFWQKIMYSFPRYCECYIPEKS